MKKQIKKIVSLALALTMIAGLTSCGKKKQEGKRYNDQGVQVITVGLQPRGAVADYNTNEMTLYFEENLGIDIQFVEFPSGAQDWRSKWTAMVTAGEELPDIMWGFGWSEDERNAWGAQGYLLDLKPYLYGDLAADYRARVAELYGDENKFDNAMKNITSTDGKIYGFPNMEQNDMYLSNTHTFINKAWLDKLGLEMPTNYDELLNVLRAFRDRDPNGNGKKDEIPAVGQVGAINTLTGTLAGNLPAWIINNWEFVDDKRFFSVKDGELYSPYVTDEYREGVKALYTLVSEGLLDTQTWTSTMGSNEMTNLWTPPSNVAICGVVSGALPSRAATDSPVALEYVPLPPFKYAPTEVALEVPNVQIFPTANCSDPEMVFKILMLQATEEGTLTCRRGKQGERWEYREDDSPAGMGIFALKPLEVPHNVHWGMFSGHLTVSSQYTKDHDIQDPTRVWYNAIQNTMRQHDELYLEVAAANNPEQIVNKLNYTKEQYEAISEVQADLMQYIKESRAKFATGAMNPYNDADWNAYLKELENKGLSTWVNTAKEVWAAQQ